mmetsp:Transcript_27106/g.68206  ORF Transcript_27106/g.68206 Transcript_27106/m.68206 type:complete len:95 (+) Transcript_27106:122-406(+)
MSLLASGQSGRECECPSQARQHQGNKGQGYGLPVPRQSILSTHVQQALQLLPRETAVVSLTECEEQLLRLLARRKFPMHARLVPCYAAAHTRLC